MFLLLLQSAHQDLQPHIEIRLRLDRRSQLLIPCQGSPNAYDRN